MIKRYRNLILSCCVLLMMYNNFLQAPGYGPGYENVPAKVYYGRRVAGFEVKKLIMNLSPGEESLFQYYKQQLERARQSALEISMPSYRQNPMAGWYERRIEELERKEDLSTEENERWERYSQNYYALITPAKTSKLCRSASLFSELDEACHEVNNGNQ